MSMMPRKTPITAETATTMIVRRVVSCRVGQVTLRSSETASPTYFVLKALRVASAPTLPGALDAPRPLAMGLPDLSVGPVHAATRAILPQLQPLGVVPPVLAGVVGPLPALSAAEGYEYSTSSFASHAPTLCYFSILMNTPEPIVRPPSRTAKRSCSSNATGDVSLMLISMLSPGITISTPSGRAISPVTSVVRM